MSKHAIPLSALEKAGLKAHGLPVGEPSQLADAFRDGVAWGLQNQPSTSWLMAAVSRPVLTAVISYGAVLLFFYLVGVFYAADFNSANWTEGARLFLLLMGVSVGFVAALMAYVAVRMGEGNAEVPLSGGKRK